MGPLLPLELKSAGDAQRLIQTASGLLASTYSDLGKYMDGSDPIAVGRAVEALDAAAGRLESCRDLMRRLSQA
jgi:hypothetical protein